jgi:hypothetical protein
MFVLNSCKFLDGYRINQHPFAVRFTILPFVHASQIASRSRLLACTINFLNLSKNVFVFLRGDKFLTASFELRLQR